MSLVHFFPSALLSSIIHSFLHALLKLISLLIILTQKILSHSFLLHMSMVSFRFSFHFNLHHLSNLFVLSLMTCWTHVVSPQGFSSHTVNRAKRQGASTTAGKGLLSPWNPGELVHKSLCEMLYVSTCI